MEFILTRFDCRDMERERSPAGCSGVSWAGGGGGLRGSAEKRGNYRLHHGKKEAADLSWQEKGQELVLDVTVPQSCLVPDRPYHPV